MLGGWGMNAVVSVLSDRCGQRTSVMYDSFSELSCTNCNLPRLTVPSMSGHLFCQDNIGVDAELLCEEINYNYIVQMFCGV